LAGLDAPHQVIFGEHPFSVKPLRRLA